MPQPPIQSDINAFIATICAYPDDDTPRLIFADWLEERDQPEFAMFIRDQIAEANLDFLDERRGELRRSWTKMYYHFRTLSFAGTPEWAKRLRNVLTRGFASHWSIPIERLKLLPELRAAHPVEAIRMTNSKGFINDSAKYLRGLTTLAFGHSQTLMNNYSEQVLDTLASRHCQSVRRLHVENMSADELTMLAKSHHFGPLEELSILAFDDSDAILPRALADGPHSRLKRLHIKESFMGYRGSREAELEALSALPALEEVTLRRYSSESWQRLIAAPGVLPWRSLTIINSRDALALLKSGKAANLEIIDMRGEEAFDPYWMEFIEALKLSRIQYLDANIRYLSEPSADHSRYPQYPELRLLDLRGEVTPPERLAVFRHMFPNCSIRYSYDGTLIDSPPNPNSWMFFDHFASILSRDGDVW
jgi:uncharacterized protein (TIGR02996 family)